MVTRFGIVLVALALLLSSPRAFAQTTTSAPDTYESLIKAAFSGETVEKRADAAKLLVQAKAFLDANGAAWVNEEKFKFAVHFLEVSRAARQTAAEGRVWYEVMVAALPPNDNDRATLVKKTEAALLFQEGKWAEAKVKFLEVEAFAFTTAYKASAAVSAARSMSNLGDVDGAIAKYQKVVTDYPFYRVAAYTEIYSLLRAGKRTEAVLALAKTVTADTELTFAQRELFVGVIADDLVKNGKSIDAITYLKSYPRTPAMTKRLMALQQDAAVRRATFVEFLAERPATLWGYSSKAFSDTEADFILLVVPANDVSQVVFADAQDVAENAKRYLRETTGRLSNEQAAAFVKQLMSGDGTKLLGTTAEAREIAAALEKTNAPTKNFFVPLFNNDIKKAAQAAFVSAKAAKTDTEYRFWIQLLAAAVRANDQCYNKRAIDVVRWVNGDLAENPVVDLITE